MRNFIYTLLLFSSVVFFSCGPTVEQAIKYNDGIIQHADTIGATFEVLVESYEKYVPEEMDKAYNNAMAITQEGIDFAQGLKPFNEDASFKDGALVLFNTYKSVLENEHKEIIKLLKLPEKDYGTDQVAQFDKLLEAAYKKIDDELDKLIVVQEKFADKHQYEITDK